MNIISFAERRFVMQIYFCYIQVCMIAMVCCEGARRKAPTNYIFLGVFTGMQNFQYDCIGSEMTLNWRSWSNLYSNTS